MTPIQALKSLFVAFSARGQWWQPANPSQPVEAPVESGDRLRWAL